MFRIRAFWYGSGSADSYLCWTDPDSARDPAFFRQWPSRRQLAVLRIHDILVWMRIRGSMPLTNGSGSFYFHHWPSRCQQKTNFFTKFFCILLLEGTFTLFFKDKKSKKSQNSRNQGFSYYFCMMIEGSGSITLTNGYGSRRPKNMWIRWIQIRIRNTDANNFFAFYILMVYLHHFFLLRQKVIKNSQNNRN